MILNFITLSMVSSCYWRYLGHYCLGNSDILYNQYVINRRLKNEKGRTKKQIDELMNQYANEEIDGDTYAQKMMELTTSARRRNG